MTQYELSRNWFDWSFENPEKINPGHTAIYFFAIEHCNRLGWKKKFGFPSKMVMEAIGIKKYQTYINYFRDLVEWGFIVMIEESKNQYSSNIISINHALPENGKALDKALDKALVKHGVKHGQSTGQSTGKSMDSIDKQYNNITNNNITNNENFDLDFVEPKFQKTFLTWIEFKKASGYPLNQQVVIEASYKELMNLSNKDPVIAEQIVNQSIAGQWKGLQPLKNNHNGNIQPIPGKETRSATIERKAAETLERRRNNQIAQQGIHVDRIEGR